MSLTTDFFNFLKKTKNPFLTKQSIIDELTQQGFKLVKMGEHPKKFGKYIFTQQNAVCALNYQTKNPAKGAKILAAHTDFPALKLKPLAGSNQQGYFKAAVEVYGAPLLQTWFDRNLSLAGAVYWRGSQQKLQRSLIDFKNPVAYIPSLAIHLNRLANEKLTLDKQKDIRPLIYQSLANRDFSAILLSKLKNDGETAAKLIIDHDLTFYDVQPPSFAGYYKEFITAQGLDNILSCFAMLKNFQTIESKDENCLGLFFDNEEIGSQTAGGAAGNFLTNVLNTIYPQQNDLLKVLSTSFLLSIDNAHGLHPNYPDKHDADHKAMINGGIVFKYNANHRYVTSGHSGSVLKELFLNHKVQYQDFVGNNKIPTGATLGHFLTTKFGLNSVDIGLATFGMHSIRELCGTKDLFTLTKALKVFIKHPLTQIN